MNEYGKMMCYVAFSVHFRRNWYFYRGKNGRLMALKIAILGCGWLGFPLARRLKNEGYQIRGSVTNEERMNELRQAGIQAFKILLERDRLVQDNTGFFDCDVLVVAFPPRRISGIEEIYPQQLQQLTDELNTHTDIKVLFVSSTSVYQEQGQTALERDRLHPDKSSGKAVAAAEHVLIQKFGRAITIVRFGGLIGADRNPARFLLHKKGTVAGNKPVNVIHRDDCLEIISRIIRQKVWGEIFNACCPEHPSRKEFYRKAAVVSKMPSPVFSSEIEPFKIIDSSRLIHQLDYQFIYPSPLDYLDQLAED